MSIDPKYFIPLGGKNYVLLPGLLDHAHNLGLLNINTILVQIPSEANKNVAIVQAIATFKGEDGPQTWSAYGDASPANLKPNMVPASIRMAETRAIGRVLRFSTNVGETAYDELPDLSQEAEKPQKREYVEKDARPSDAPRVQPPQSANEGTQTRCYDCTCDLIPGMVKTSIAHYGIALCMTCRRNRERIGASA